MNIDIARQKLKATKMVASYHKNTMLMAITLYGEIKLGSQYSKYSPSSLETYLYEQIYILKHNFLWEDEHIGELYAYWYGLTLYLYAPEPLEYTNQDIQNAEIFNGKQHLK